MGVGWVFFLACAGIRPRCLFSTLSRFQIALAIAATAVGIWTSEFGLHDGDCLGFAQAPVVYNRIRKWPAQGCGLVVGNGSGFTALRHRNSSVSDGPGALKAGTWMQTVAMGWFGSESHR